MKDHWLISYALWVEMDLIFPVHRTHHPLGQYHLKGVIGLPLMLLSLCREPVAIGIKERAKIFLCSNNTLLGSMNTRLLLSKLSNFHDV